MKHLCITVRWLDDRYHGQMADGTPEWPPSPLRLFQALVAAAGRQPTFGLGGNSNEALALEWMETLCKQPPTIVAPQAFAGGRFVRYVPNNDSDKKFARRDRLSEKALAPTVLVRAQSVAYIWSIPDAEQLDASKRFHAVSALAEKITTLGWGVDMAAGNAELLTAEEVAILSGEYWLPGEKGIASGLRVPVKGTLKDLRRRHKEFLERIRRDGLRPPSPLTVFERYEYRRADEPSRHPIACFALRRPDSNDFRPFDPVRSIGRVAGLMRHTVSSAAKRNNGWPDPGTFILGHGEKEGDRHVSVNNRRFAYLPLPSIESRGPGRVPIVGSIRRACLAVFQQGHDEEIEWARQVLGGDVLAEESTGEVVACLSLQYESDPVVKRYREPASRWATVTPVVLPGYDDPAHFRRRIQRGVSAEEQKRLLGRLDSRIERLLRKTITDAGFSQELAAHAELDWRPTGFWPGTARADHYRVPDYLVRFNRLHVCIRWLNARGEAVRIPGPICLGGGRFMGLGLFAALWD